MAEEPQTAGGYQGGRRGDPSISIPAQGGQHVEPWSRGAGKEGAGPVQGDRGCHRRPRHRLLFPFLGGWGISPSSDLSHETKTPFSGTAENKENLNCPITLSITPRKACRQAQPATLRAQTGHGREENPERKHSLTVAFAIWGRGANADAASAPQGPGRSFPTGADKGPFSPRPPGLSGAGFPAGRSGQPCLQPLSTCPLGKRRRPVLSREGAGPAARGGVSSGANPGVK